MSYVVTRSDGRYEIRESVSTPRGPRSRTLATFRVLTTEVLDRAERRATRPFDRAELGRRAAEHRIPTGWSSAATRSARDLLTQLRAGHRPGTVLAALLGHELGRAPRAIPDSVPGALEWIAAGPQQRGAALRDLLRLAGRVPARRLRGELTFPRIATTNP